MPIIGVGTWQTFDVGNDTSARAPLREVLKLLNGNLIDSSPMYGARRPWLGTSRQNWASATSSSSPPRYGRTGAKPGIAQMETSQAPARRAHGPHAGAQPRRRRYPYKDAARLEDKKRIRYIGITHYTASAYGEVERAMKTRQYDFLQINYSLSERESENDFSKLGKTCGWPSSQPAVRRRRALPAGQGQPLPPGPPSSASRAGRSTS